jgi:hypothetical protein
MRSMLTTERKERRCGWSSDAGLGQMDYLIQMSSTIRKQQVAYSTKEGAVLMRNAETVAN